MSGDTNYNQPQPVSYGEGMREALEAQVALLTGSKVGEDGADFRGIRDELGLEEGSNLMEELVRRYEAPLRKTTAQIDTDVLRQTIIGDETRSTYTDDGRIIEGYETPSGPSGEGTYRLELTESGTVDGRPDLGREGYRLINDKGMTVLETSTSRFDNGRYQTRDRIEDAFKEEAIEKGFIRDPQQWTDITSSDFPDKYLINPESGKLQESQPVYRKNEDGTDFVAEPGTFEAGETIRSGTGMVDLLGDTRDITQYDTRTATQADVDAGLADAVGDTFIAETQTTDQAGFRDGEFKGLSALAEDVQAGNLSRQRERDLQDVARLSPLYSEIMDEYKPGTKQAVSDARKVLNAQQATLTGAGAIDAPASVAGGMGNITSGGIDASLAGGLDPLRAETGYQPSAAVAGGNIEADALRKALMSDAEASLAKGLTAREQEQIEQASRRRATALGRAFDRGSIADEVQSRVLEDRNRQAQNRAYAQQVLGQEAGLQESDLGRGLQASLANQQAANRAAEFGVGSGMQQEQAQAGLDLQTSLANQAAFQDAAKYSAQERMQAQLANEANRQQASSFDVSAKMDQQRLNEQLKQQGTLGYVDAATKLAALEDTSTLDPFQAVLGRAGGGSLQAGQGVFGQAGYGLQSAPQYLDPSAGLGYIQAQNANQASMYNAQLGADAARKAGMFGGLGSLGGGILGGILGR